MIASTTLRAIALPEIWRPLSIVDMVISCLEPFSLLHVSLISLDFSIPLAEFSCQ
jgi:hypothetical protein